MQQSELHWKKEVENLESIQKRSKAQNARLKELKKRIGVNYPQKGEPESVDDVNESDSK